MNTFLDLNSDFTIGKISPYEIPQIFKIELSCYPTPWTLKNFYDEIAKSSGFNWYIKSQDNILLGYLFSYIISDEMFITNICIHQNYRSLNIGSTLLKTILHKAANSFIKSIFLEVREKNHFAIKMYLSNGFVIDCVRKKFYTNGDNAILMHLELNH
jgi:[ribosomal protein S18]-alanine N-acetyltransferase